MCSSAPICVTKEAKHCLCCLDICCLLQFLYRRAGDVLQCCLPCPTNPPLPSAPQHYPSPWQQHQPPPSPCAPRLAACWRSTGAGLPPSLAAPGRLATCPSPPAAAGPAGAEISVHTESHKLVLPAPLQQDLHVHRVLHSTTGVSTRKDTAVWVQKLQ
jgi:hypothetical protein